MAVAFRDKTFGDGNNTSTFISEAQPAGTQVGDLLVIYLFCGSFGAHGANWTAPAEWTLHAQSQTGNYNFSADGWTRSSLAIFWKIATVAGTGSGEFFNAPANGTVMGIMMAYTGHDPVTPLRSLSLGSENNINTSRELVETGPVSNNRPGLLVTHVALRTGNFNVGIEGTVSPAGTAKRYDYQRPTPVGTGNSGGGLSQIICDGPIAANTSSANPLRQGLAYGAAPYLSSMQAFVIQQPNSAPNTPTGLAPSGAQGVNTVTLSAVVSDPNGDNCYAQFRVGGVAYNGSTVASGGTSTYSFAGAANTTYTLDARAVDSAGLGGAYTAQQTFTTNRPPTAPAVTAPNGGEVYNTFHAVSWTAGSDPDGQALTYDVDLTTDGGGTWSNLKTAFSGTSFTHDFTNVAASTACRVRVRSRDTLNALSAYDESNANFTVQHNRAPTAPILGQPGSGSTQDLAAGYTFTYTATDPDAGDAASAWAFRRKITGAAAYEYWNAGTGVFQAALVWNTNPTGSVAFASAKWTNGNTYTWSVATKDTLGVEGPFAADFSVTASSVATTTVTAPAGSVTTTSRPLVRWTLTQPEGQPQQTYQVRVFTEAVAAAVGFDPTTTAATWETVETTSAGAREYQVGMDLVNGTAYRAYVRLKSANLYTAWANSAFSMALTPPPAATLVVTDEPTSPFGPRVRLDVDLGYAAPFTQANTTISVERSDDGGLTWVLVRGGERMPLTVDGSAVALDYEPPRGVPVQYRAFSVGDV